VAEFPQGYRDIPEEERKKAEAFFQRGQAVAGTGNYEYAIEMYLQGLAIDPESVEAHQTLRDISLRRKASGGKKLGMFESMKLKSSGKDDKQNMLNYEKLLGYDPGNTDHMVGVLQSAQKAGFYDTVLWIGPILLKANFESPKQDYNKYITLRDVYRSLHRWKLATEACQYAANLRPDDMDLQTELKNLGAMTTIHEGDYEAGDFRKSIRDREKQEKLLEQDRDVRSVDAMQRQIMDAEKEWQADPSEPGKLMKFVEVLVKTEHPDYEARAIELLENAYTSTKQFRFRQNIGKIRLYQLMREDRSLRAQVAKDPENERLKEEYRAFSAERAQQELDEYALWSENYPTDMGIKFELAKRLFVLERFDEAIPVFQTARNDPKYRIEAGMFLGRAFLLAGFVDEAVDTLKGLIDGYELAGDARSIEMTYWYARALEQQGDTATAIKSYSRVAQWNFNYRDVQTRVKRLRSGGTSPAT
jgi:tetratricopeptide (TPR) repeat protein